MTTPPGDFVIQNQKDELMEPPQMSMSYLSDYLPEPHCNLIVLPPNEDMHKSPYPVGRRMSRGDDIFVSAWSLRESPYKTLSVPFSNTSLVICSQVLL